MAFEIKHQKVSAKSDGQDDSLLQPSHWNAAHKITVPAESLVGRSLSSEGDAEAIAIGDGLNIDAGSKILSAVESNDVAVGTVPAIPANMPNYRVFTDTTAVQWDKATVNQIKANLAPGGVTPAHMEVGVQGEVMVWGASGVPLRLAPGAAGLALVSGGASVTPAWGYSGAPHAALECHRNSGVDDGDFNSGGWRTRVISDEIYDPFQLVSFISPNRLRIVPGEYVMEWSAPGYKVGRHQTRLRNITDGVTVKAGTSEMSTNSDGVQTKSTGIARFSIVAPATFKDYEIQHFCGATVADFGFGLATGTGELEVYTQVKIWRVGV